MEIGKGLNFIAIRDKITKQEYLDNFIAFSRAEGLLDIDPSESKNEGRSEEILYTTSYGVWDFPFESGDVIRPLAVIESIV